jgi:hypothetical protein
MAPYQSIFVSTIEETNRKTEALHRSMNGAMSDQQYATVFRGIQQIATPAGVAYQGFGSSGSDQKQRPDSVTPPTFYGPKQ